MRFTPKTEKELNEANLWEKGIYAFEILEAEETTSKTGKDMIKMKVKIYNGDKSQILFDYLLPDTMEYKLRHLCDACNLITEYETGNLEAYNLVGKTGKAKIGISVDKTGQYADRNSINDFVVDAPRDLDTVLNGDSAPF